MKKISVVLVSLFAIQFVYSQDKIHTKDNQELQVKIVEQTNKLIKYKLVDYDDGPIISIKNSRIEKIEYKNGQIDLLGNQNLRHYRPFGINAGITYSWFEESADIILNMDYFLLPQIDLQLNYGSQYEIAGSRFSLGSRFHLNSDFSNHKFTPFIGVLFGAEFGTQHGAEFGEESGEGFIQVPIGINYIAKKGYNASLSLNQLIFMNEFRQSNFIELTLGWKFKI